MLKKFLLGVSLLVAVGLTSAAAQAATEPTLHEVYQAAQAGRYIEAQDMMDQVLKNHPNSAKAHFAEAELLAKQAKLNQAHTELDKAERLQPGLPFASPQAVSSLKTLITSPAKSLEPMVPAAPHYPVAAIGQAPRSQGLPWGMLLAGVVLLAGLVLVMRLMQQRTAAPVPYYPAGFGNAAGAQPMGGGLMGGAGVPMGTSGSGIGSGIMGGLATGAALGAGMVAGEALMHHFTDGGHPSAVVDLPSQSGLNDNFNNNNWATPAEDMGGNDFGISDASSWDSGGGSDDSWG